MRLRRGRPVAAATWPAVVAGAAFGALVSLVNQLSSAYGLGADLPTGLRSGLRVLSLLIGVGPAWVLLPLPLGWWAARRSGGRGPARVAGAVAGGVGVVAAVVAYYLLDAALTGRGADGAAASLRGDVGALVLWSSIGLPGGLLLGAVAASLAVRRRRDA